MRTISVYILLLLGAIALLCYPSSVSAFSKHSRHKEEQPTGYIQRITDTLTNAMYPIYVIEGNKIYDYSDGKKGNMEYELLDNNHYMQYRYSDDSGAGTVPSKFYYDENCVIELCPNSRDTIGVFNGNTLTYHDNTGDLYQYRYAGDMIEKVHVMKPQNFIYYYEVSGIPAKLVIMMMLGGHCYH